MPRQPQRYDLEVPLVTTGDDVKACRAELGRVLGLRISTSDLGRALGLTGDAPDRLVRRWEDDAPTGPAAVAMTLMLIAARDGGRALEYVRGLFGRE